jgi:hypothetical protein
MKNRTLAGHSVFLYGGQIMFFLLKQKAIFQDFSHFPFQSTLFIKALLASFAAMKEIKEAVDFRFRCSLSARRAVSPLAATHP